MICSMSSKALAVLIVSLGINLAAANELVAGGSSVVSSIDTDSSISTASSLASPSSTTSATSAVSSTDPENDGSGSTTATPTSLESSSATTIISSIVATPSSLGLSSAFNDSSIFNCMAQIFIQVSPADTDLATAPGTLPITPAITPGFSAAGVLLILSGAVYAALGIRYKYFHVFTSAAYLTSLAVAVLIIYVMSLPVSNSIQGAYVAASIVAGLIVGGASLVLVDMMQGLGCLLGGFTFSMWLLVLKPGGLLSSRGGRVGFIAALTLAGFSTSFSHITRPYGLIVFISFSGSTAIVLGIDCFTRAGLKEFWVYLWNINNDLFAIGATTYPITKGIYAEIAVIIVLSLGGIASQTRLWKIVKESREKRAAEQLEGDKARAEEEANIGRGIESLNTRDREQWEAAHGLKDQPEALPSDRDSGVGDMESQKKSPITTITPVLQPEQDEVRMTELPQSSPAIRDPTSQPGCDNNIADDLPQDVQKSASAESELDSDEKSITGTTNRSSYASTKQVSYVERPDLRESNTDQPMLGELNSEQPTLGESNSEMPIWEEINTEQLTMGESNSEGQGLVASSLSASSEVQKLDLGDPLDTTCEVATAVDREKLPLNQENATLPLMRSPSQLLYRANSVQSRSNPEQPRLSSSSEPSNNPCHGDLSLHTLQPSVEPQLASEQYLGDQGIGGSASLETSQTSMEPLMEDNLGPLPSSTPSTRRSSCIPFGDNTLMGKRDSIIRSKSNLTFYSTNSNGRESTRSLPSQAQGNVSQRGSIGGESVYNRDYGLASTTSLLDDNMPLSARRNLLRQPSFPSNPPHSVRRQYSGPSPMAREQQLASFRMGIQRERQSSIVPNVALERQRSMLWQEKRVEGQKMAIEQRRREEKETAFDQGMRRGDMLNAHREAMRKMQAKANKHV